MALTINTNLSSLVAQRHLSASQAGLATAVQRLSSGLRVNSAKDDAAGLAIAERMNTQVRGAAVAMRNANDGISLAQTAEGALGTVGGMLQRIRELSVQAANATNSRSDRAALQAEVAQLASEVDRVARQSQFNGRNLLDGSFDGAAFQVGANAGDTITVATLADTRATQLSAIAYNTETLRLDTTDTPVPAIADYGRPIEAGVLSITVGGTAVTLGKIGPAGSSAERLGQAVAAINEKSAVTGVTAYVSGEGTGTRVALMSSLVDGDGVPLDVDFNGFTADTTGLRSQWTPTPASYMAALTTAADAATFSPADFESVLSKVVLNNTSLPYEGASSGQFAAYWASPSAANAQALVAAIDNSNYGYHYPDIYAARDAYMRADPKTDALAAAYANALNTHFGAGLAAPTGSTPWTKAQTLAADQVFVQAEQGVHLMGGMSMFGNYTQKFERGIHDVDISSQPGAWVALLKMDSALDQVNSARATLGAVQSRFESTIANLAVAGENTAAARSRIVDADFAAETAQLSRQQVLQNAGTAMVAQANVMPQRVLALLQGL